MKKIYRLTIDFEIEINEKVKVPGEESEDPGEYPPGMLEKTQHIMNAFFMNPGILHEYIKFRLYWRFLAFNHLEKLLHGLLGVQDEDQLLPLLTKDIPIRTVPYFTGFCGLNNIDFPGTDTEEEMAKEFFYSQFWGFNPFRGSLVDIGDEVGDNHAIIPINNRCLGDCMLARQLRDFFSKEVKYAR